MKSFFRNAFKVSMTSLFVTIGMTILLFGLLQLSGVENRLLYNMIKVYIAIALPVLTLCPIVGFIYSFYIKGKRKILLILLHLAAACTISVFAFAAFMFRYFVSFAP
ncbi:hypothetical protein [Neobacillus mesonae]|uniref:hypothetical protein n=1 Tax=Neobacillus mesonae TaxID=1193713 RepID=UPI00203AA61C|nr:hypothetical protein [Neobacillus mesonae]MCM3567995.1 hypothetical protein [Neobacillus mesonae]